VPDAVIDRPEARLSVPVARWLNTGARSPGRSSCSTHRSWQSIRAARRNHARRLWPQLMLAWWSEALGNLTVIEP